MGDRRPGPSLVWAISLLGLAVIGVCVTLLVVSSGLSARVGDIDATTKAGRERGYINRAETCRLQVGIGLAPDRECLAPEVTRYYDPAERPVSGTSSPGQVMNRQALCSIQRALDVGDSPLYGLPECSHP